MLSFKNIAKQFADGTRALHQVSLEIPRGQFCVVLGPSGAGKSTLLRMVNGLALTSEGSVAVDGVEVTPANLYALRPRIGMIHQQFNLVERSTVLANVLAGALPTVPLWRAVFNAYPLEVRRKAARLLHEVGLDQGQLSRRITEMSGGQQQRVGIARAFMLDPTVVLADEPVASLDPKTSRDILDLLKQSSRLHASTVLCTLHQVDLAREFADRIVALRAGEVVFDGAPQALDDTTLRHVFGAHQARAEAGVHPPIPEPVVALGAVLIKEASPA
ncbi:phosphonate transport system ATP-binding protein [Hydrogenophaga palleronii]|uniref:Phosphonate transport system ATP-binding protein n=1 Tax=Hydrogenophaga palleronii TaxID=65655 RepID=A0ABU1WUA7_9BURK|nr:phosphonate ABC transporter ATP-binding protein [Hydrogenophaga palleronii]MDR7152878.1 phosphonate transport system ATP-binding protein [Hydrogenophaga palleronii]